MKLPTAAALAALIGLGAPTLASATEPTQTYPDYQACQNHKTGATVAGALIGGLAGAVLGSQVSGHGARTEGSVIGGGLGALVGAAVGDEKVNCGPSPTQQARRQEYDNGWGTPGPVDHSYDDIPGAPRVPPAAPPQGRDYDRDAAPAYQDDGQGSGDDGRTGGDDRGYQDDSGRGDGAYRDQASGEDQRTYQDQQSYQDQRSYEDQRADQDRDGDVDDDRRDDADQADQAARAAEDDADGRWRDHARQDQPDWRSDRWQDDRSYRGDGRDDSYRDDPRDQDDDDMDDDQDSRDDSGAWRRPIN
jgi:hypothetical protein